MRYLVEREFGLRRCDEDAGASWHSQRRRWEREKWNLGTRKALPTLRDTAIKLRADT
jgi:hypothetical protein